MYNTAVIEKAFEGGQTAIHISNTIFPSEKPITEVEKIEPINSKPVYRFMKRLFDLTASILGLFVLCIPMLVIGIWIKLDSEGPIIFTQERLGLNQKPFVLYKFRSMCINAEAGGPQWAKKEDSRVTKAGRFLRKTRLDELPQLINIIAGNMSLVGPRPEREVFYHEFETYIKGFSQRLMVKPGLTGLAQINGGYDLLPEEKIIFDIEYIKKRSFWLDMKLILKTVFIVFNHKGAR